METWIFVFFFFRSKLTFYQNEFHGGAFIFFISWYATKGLWQKQNVLQFYSRRIKHNNELPGM